MYTPLACPEYYGASVPPAADSRQRTCPPPGPGARTGRATTDGSHVPCVPIGQLGTQLYSRSIANGYAADLHRGLPTGYLKPASELTPTTSMAVTHCTPSHIHQI